MARGGGGDTQWWLENESANWAQITGWLVGWRLLVGGGCFCSLWKTGWLAGWAKLSQRQLQNESAYNWGPKVAKSRPLARVSQQRLAKIVVERTSACALSAQQKVGRIWACEFHLLSGS